MAALTLSVGVSIILPSFSLRCWGCRVHECSCTLLLEPKGVTVSVVWTFLSCDGGRCIETLRLEYSI